MAGWILSVTSGSKVALASPSGPPVTTTGSEPYASKWTGRLPIGVPSPMWLAICMTHVLHQKPIPKCSADDSSTQVPSARHIMYIMSWNKQKHKQPLLLQQRDLLHLHNSKNIPLSGWSMSAFVCNALNCKAVCIAKQAPDQRRLYQKY